jgi:hypothetical protein
VSAPAPQLHGADGQRDGVARVAADAEVGARCCPE